MNTQIQTKGESQGTNRNRTYARATHAVFDDLVKPIGDPCFKVFDISPLMDVIRVILQVEPDDGWRVCTCQGKRFWLIPNEVGGLTLMFPEDY